MTETNQTKLYQKLLTITKPNTAKRICTYIDQTPFDPNKVHRVYKKNPYTICIDVDHYEKPKIVTTIHIPLYTKQK